MSFRRIVWFVALVVQFALISELALAQIKVVTVTAQKRDESQQEVPLSLSSFSGDFLEESGIKTLTELSNYTPNFRIDTFNTPRNSRLKIRGIGGLQSNPGVEPSVGVYLDGAYIPRIGSMLTDLVDIQTVEVLRGPQGTLYGRNTPVGALNVNTRAPSHDFEAQGNILIGNYKNFGTSGFVNGGLTDDIALRVTAYARNYGGSTKNLYTDDSSNGFTNFGIRAKLLFDPGSNFDTTFVADFNRVKFICCQAQTIFLSAQAATTYGLLSAGSGIPLAQFYNGTGLTPGTSGHTGEAQFDRRVSNNDDHSVINEQHGFALTANYEFGDGHNIKSISAFRDWRDKANLSFDGTPATTFIGDSRNTELTFSQEFQFTSPEGGIDYLNVGMPLEYLLGFTYFLHDSTYLDQIGFGPDVVFLGVAPLTATAIGLAQNDYWEQNARSYAFFGQAKLNLIPDVWSVTGGMRYSHDSKHAVKTSRCVSANAFLCSPTTGQLTNLSYDLTTSDNSITWMASTSYYVTPDVHFYFTAATGYKASGLNARAVRVAQPAPLAFDEETSMDYELGVKSTFFDSTVLFNLNLYRTTVDDFQQNTRFPGAIVSYVGNAGKLRVQGVEIEAQYAPTDWLEFRGSTAYLHSRWVSHTNASCDANVTAGLVLSAANGRCDFTGLVPEDAPKWTGSMGSTITRPFTNSGIEWFVSADMNYRGRFFFDETLDKRSIEEAYILVDGRVGIQDPEKGWTLTFWGKNILNKDYYTYKIGATVPAIQRNAGSYYGYLGEPRTLGVEGTVEF